MTSSSTGVKCFKKYLGRKLLSKLIQGSLDKFVPGELPNVPFDVRVLQWQLIRPTNLKPTLGRYIG